MVGFTSRRSQVRVWGSFFGRFRAGIRGDRGLMSDTFRFTGPLTEFWWTCEIDFLDLWDPLQLCVRVVLIPLV